MVKQLTEGNFKQYLTNEVKFIIGIGSFLIAVGIPYFGIRTDIALINQSIANINQNHEVHIQDIDQAILAIQTQQKADEEKIIANQEAIIKLLTVLHLNN